MGVIVYKVYNKERWNCNQNDSWFSSEIHLNTKMEYWLKPYDNNPKYSKNIMEARITNSWVKSSKIVASSLENTFLYLWWLSGRNCHSKHNKAGLRDSFW